MRIVWRVSVMGLALVALGALAAQAEDTPGKNALKVGDPVPDFTLKSIDGKEYKLSDFKGKAVVLDFVSQNCPWSRGHDKTMPDLAKKYGEKGVVFFGIDADAKTTVEDIREYAKENAVTYTILKDEGNKYADALKASKTPEIYIIDGDQKLVYHGAYDNRKSPDAAGDTNYVAEALDAVLAQEPVKLAETNAWGCSIRRA